MKKGNIFAKMEKDLAKHGVSQDLTPPVKWGLGHLSHKQISKIGRKGGAARAAALSEKELSAIGRKGGLLGGRPGTVRARAKALGLRIPRGASRQRAWSIVKKAEQTKNRRRR
jgi:hypothetical protein